MSTEDSIRGREGAVLANRRVTAGCKAAFDLMLSEPGHGYNTEEETAILLSYIFQVFFDLVHMDKLGAAQDAATAARRGDDFIQHLSTTEKNHFDGAMQTLMSRDVVGRVRAYEARWAAEHGGGDAGSGKAGGGASAMEL